MKRFKFPKSPKWRVCLNYYSFPTNLWKICEVCENLILCKCFHKRESFFKDELPLKIPNLKIKSLTPDGVQFDLTEIQSLKYQRSTTIRQRYWDKDQSLLQQFSSFVVCSSFQLRKSTWKIKDNICVQNWHSASGVGLVTGVKTFPPCIRFK